MIEFEINKNKYEIGDVTIGQFYKIQHLLALQTADAKLEVISHLSGCPVKELKKLENFQFLQLFTEVAEGPLNAQADQKLYKHIGLNGKAYGLLDFSKITIGEFADLDVLKADPKKEQKLHVMMAIVYRPAMVINETFDWVIIEPYDSDNVMERAEEFLDLPLKHVYSALNFFLRIPNYLLKVIENSLMKEMEEMMKKPMTNEERELVKISNLLILESLGDGMTPSTLSQETISLRLTRLQELAQSLSSTISHIEKTKQEKKKPLMKKLKDKIKYKS
jgi:hypothetical protein